MLAVATRLLEGSRCCVQVDSVLFSRCWRYLDEGWEEKAQLGGEHGLPLPSSGEGTFHLMSGIRSGVGRTGMAWNCLQQ